ncbi:polysaccharide biosynthesis tyrosine autokinase [Pseudoduganella namucuonensis]|uniref:Receptor protein-tyrosine kinase n=1 Tax=Pseudoduganella namucuonensis TaxID=1035707 RepID=A0A1I7M519_9BURK|nr:polysaccharide biosynthesis tyrosine autokinase [Pseudoduganella namucuonensis]SFV17032.1 receptor protein-tyrosine kinase [Pseudoduganella namucuonensis]
MKTSNPIPIASENASAQRGAAVYRPIGTILKDGGLLSVDAIRAVCETQQLDGTLFGATAIALGMISENDLAEALRHQFGCCRLLGERLNVSAEVVAAYRPDDANMRPLRDLRGMLMLRHLNHCPDGQAIALTSAHRCEGRSLMSANLAVLFAQMNWRTLLIDADFRSPRQHEYFALQNRRGLSSALNGYPIAELLSWIPGLGFLAVMPTGAPPPNPEELLGRSMLAIVLEQVKRDFDIVLIDTPSCELNHEAYSVSACAGNTIVVVKNGHSSVASLKKMRDSLENCQVNILGYVLNEF